MFLLIKFLNAAEVKNRDTVRQIQPEGEETSQKEKKTRRGKNGLTRVPNAQEVRWGPSWVWEAERKGLKRPSSSDSGKGALTNKNSWAIRHRP